MPVPVCLSRAAVPAPLALNIWKGPWPSTSVVPSGMRFLAERAFDLLAVERDAAAVLQHGDEARQHRVGGAGAVRGEAVVDAHLPTAGADVVRGDRRQLEAAAAAVAAAARQALDDVEDHGVVVGAGAAARQRLGPRAER